MWGGPGKQVLALALLAASVQPAIAAYGSGKSKFMEAYPILFKFCLFWWCIFVFIVMGVYILDHLLFRKFGPAKVQWSAERVFKAPPGGGREEYWAQLANPTKWGVEHPIIQSADIRMVRCGETDSADADAAVAKAAEDVPEAAPLPGQRDEDFVAPSAKLRPIAFRPMEVGLGFILRHKASLGGPRAGTFFCGRKCTELEQAEGGKWRLVMRTIEIGNGYPYEPDSEFSEVELDPPGEDGSVRCVISGSALTTSRIYRWWNGLQPSSQAAAEGMLEAIESMVLSAKKKD